MIKQYINYLKYTFTTDSGSDDFDVGLAVIPIGSVLTILFTLVMELFT